MKKTLLFVGVFGVLLSANAFADDPVTFGNDTQTYPAFTDSYANVSTDNGRAAANTYQYAAKKETDESTKIKAATVKYVRSRAAEADSLVTDLTTRTTTDQGVVSANQTELDGTTGATAWENKGLKTNRQVQAGSTECSGNWNTNNQYSGCGYINDGTHTDGQTGSNYKWVKIATHCLVDTSLAGCQS